MGLGRRLAWAFSACLLALAACGGDDNNGSSGAAGSAGKGGSAAAGSGGKSSSAGAGGSSGSGTGTGEEGSDCGSDTDCGSGLKCLPGAVLQGQTRSLLIKVCARNCTQDTDCMEGESCTSDVTKQPKDALCWSTTKEAFKPCGPADTSKCDGDLECLPVLTDTNSIGGFCVLPCDLPTAGKMVTASCPEGLSCLDELGIEGTGLCAKRAARGETCGPDVGAICNTEDVCLIDPKDNSSLCYQDCTKDKKCETGKSCVQLEADLFYCE